MSGQAAVGDNSIFRVPTNAQEYSALGLALLAVFGLVQFGAPIVRELDFLDQKIRDVFIGAAFAAFPFLHRGAKNALNGFKAAPSRPELSPWFVSGAFVATLVFAWNQFVSLVGGFSIGLFVGTVGVSPQTAAEAIDGAAVNSILAFALPLTAVASILAGVLLFRNTRSHIVLALGFATLLFILFNVLVTWVTNPAFLFQQWGIAEAGGVEGIIQFFIGMGIVAAIVFVFGGIGVLISRFMSEGSLGKVMVAARRLSPADREILAADISNRVEAALRAKMGPPGPAAAEP
ncbi:MAG: hypothetical protein HOP13_08790 [Alphaproteobacteria bacterium]|nr:hypothetical protein [Alphaproteobacteria bacterium]